MRILANHQAIGALGATAVLSLAGCGSDVDTTATGNTVATEESARTQTTTADSSVTSESPTESETGNSGAGTEAAETSFPVTIENCGESHTYDAAPMKAVTMNQHVTEILLAFGLEDSMVGTAYIDSSIRADLVEAYDSVPVLAAQYPNREQVLAAEPDIVLGGYASAFGDDAAGDRTTLAGSGINSYLTEGYCPDFTGPVTLDQVRDDISNIGAIFGVSDRAAELLDTMKVPIDEATAAVGDLDPVSVFVYDSGIDKAFTAAGNEMTTALVELAGATNVFDDVDDRFTEVSWEDVVDRDPDAVLILDYGSDSVEDKEAFLKADPIASTLRAVQEESFAAIDLTDVVPGIRNGDTVLTLAQSFHPDAFG